MIIKYRFWDLEMKHMVSWEEMEDQWLTEGYSTMHFLEDHYKCMQYTNQNDIAGTEIYKSDILEKEGRLYIMKWVKGSWDMGYSACLLDVEYGVDHNEFKIVGNIYQDPKLGELANEQ